MAIGIFVTEMDRLDYQGGAIINAALNGCTTIMRKNGSGALRNYQLLQT